MTAPSCVATAETTGPGAGDNGDPWTTSGKVVTGPACPCYKNAVSISTVLANCYITSVPDGLVDGTVRTG